MSSPEAPSGIPADWLRLEPVECPVCGQVTMPNELGDGSYICSCPGERPLPLVMEGRPFIIPSPVDDKSFGTSGSAPSSGRLPEQKGQFGRDIETEDYAPLRDAPSGVPDRAQPRSDSKP